jgi:AcrR family transcriptional regulator
MSGPAQARRPGRPRSPEAHAAILRAALELALEGGLRGLSMEAIAARAGVGKATIYRRWKTKEALFAEALHTIALNPEAPDTGSVRGDFAAASGAAIERMTPDAFRIIPRLLADAAGDPELLEALQAALLRPRQAIVADILRRGVERGELRADLDVELAAEILIGSGIARALVSGGDPAGLRELPMRVLDTLLEGIAAPRRVTAGQPRVRRRG